MATIKKPRTKKGLAHAASMAADLGRRRTAVQPEVDALYAAFEKRLKRGTLITYEEIDAAIGVSHDEDAARWASIVNPWRKRIETVMGIHCRTVMGVGIKLCQPREQLVVSSRRVAAGMTSLRRARELSEVLTDAECTETERELRDQLNEIAGKAREQLDARMERFGTFLLERASDPAVLSMLRHNGHLRLPGPKK